MVVPGSLPELTKKNVSSTLVPYRFDGDAIAIPAAVLRHCPSDPVSQIKSACAWTDSAKVVAHVHSGGVELSESEYMSMIERGGERAGGGGGERR